MIKNWWYYYKWYVICGAVLFFIVLDIIENAAGWFKDDPDIQIAYNKGFNTKNCNTKDFNAKDCNIKDFNAKDRKMKDLPFKVFKMKNTFKKTALLSACLLLAGCSPSLNTGGIDTVQQDGPTAIGSIMTVDAPPEFILLDHKDVLAADGLYYAAWGTGQPAPYENSSEETAEFFDAQLYLLASEADDEKSAEKSCLAWLSSAEDKYKIRTTDTITCNGQSYTLIAYDCIGKDSPYSRGVSALGVHGSSAVCAELTCTKDYKEDLASLLKGFLNGCRFY